MLFHSPNVTAKDGPIARLRQVDSMPEFRGVVTDMFRRPQHELGLWLHHVREVWRQAQWTRVSRDRPAFKGIQKGILRDQTLAYLRRLDHDSMSSPGETVTVAHEDARMRAAVLRLLLSGGLVTQDVVCRHRYQTKKNCDCSKGGPQTVEHVSWECAHHDGLRQPITHLLARIRRAQPCFKYATIMTEADSGLLPHLELVQRTLVDIWQSHIRQYLTGDFLCPDDGARPADSGSRDSAQRTIADGIHENGHFIKGAPNGGIFCVKCGKFVTEVRHRRLKISRTKCKQANLPQRQWLTDPNYTSNPHRLLALFQSMRPHAGQHRLAWDGSVSRSAPHGIVKCLQCDKQWPWNNRHNMKRTPQCSQRKRRRVRTPPRWVSLRAVDTDYDTAVAVLQRVNANAHDAPASARRRRIRGKTKVVSNEVNDSSILSSASRVHADDFAFHELSAFLFDDMG